MVIGSHDPTGTAADVEMTTVDHEVEVLGLVPDVMKIDVEGYEYEVLRGAQELLRRRKPVLCLEPSDIAGSMHAILRFVAF